MLLVLVGKSCSRINILLNGGASYKVNIFQKYKTFLVSAPEDHPLDPAHSSYGFAAVLVEIVLLKRFIL